MTNAFNGQILAEKLSKLNNSQQSIETLSHWCIYHRKKAKQVVETWEKLFNSSQREQRVPFLYLANDILQNSRRKGSEFVHEFWKVLPGALKVVSENGDDYGKNVATRLVDIWEERKVFGSRGKSLKDEMLVKDPPPLLENNGKSSQSQSMKIVKKDAHSIRLKLAVGSTPEKIITAFQSVHDEHVNEDTVLNKCKAAVRRVGKMEKDVEDASIHGNLQDSTLANELQEQETALRQYIEKLKSVEAIRATLVAQLKEAIQEQESKLELVRTQLQVAQDHVLQANSLTQRLSSGPVSGPGPTMTTPPMETTAAEPKPSPNQMINTQPLPPQPVTSFANSKTTMEEEHKRAAAAVAAKLTASSSSAQMLSSILSSLAAEEAASMNGSLHASSFTTSFPVYPPDKRPKLEKPMPVSDMSNGYFTPIQQQQQPGSLPFPPVQVSAANMQSMSQTNQQQPPFAPPLPPLPPPPPPVQQYVQSGVLAGAGTMPYGYGGSSLPPPPPPLPNHMVMGLARPSTQPQQQPSSQQPLSQPPPLHSVPAGFYQSPGIGFYGQSHAPTTPVTRA
ncbi:hypothetical protein MRB53_008304 [Persea americana]|uniref:Uncharacterized protein n=1 Tax=Persea americana TaxID=3435 RepID=A0ACC2MLC7_PERAE|nr:hypothetical protein MRB53_008304 [Persea americana]|eukprot:TRINITY_DN5491_c0_g1_i4.p1 TRINITY_DN5491_c0_g1~~TRINITY_DN5491_c0_g1_i4.p1  ORF type:complete len:562 (-),score=156.57 TRINITY_DN5491_c0_g1_i4:462-2147(-)